jgi:hypothetical protein
VDAGRTVKLKTMGFPAEVAVIACTPLETEPPTLSVAVIIVPDVTDRLEKARPGSSAVNPVLESKDVKEPTSSTVSETPCSADRGEIISAWGGGCTSNVAVAVLARPPVSSDTLAGAANDAAAVAGTKPEGTVAVKTTPPL